MNKLLKLSIILTMALTTLSCGKKKSVTNSKISLISGISALTSEFQGGVGLFVRNKSTGHLLLKDIIANDEVIEFSNGTYDFLIMAWTGPTKMTGTAHCASKGDITLDGNDVTLNFNLSSTDCDTLATKSGALFFHSNPMGGKIPAIDGDYSVRLILPKYNGTPSINKNEIPTEIFGATCLVKNSVDDSLNLDSSTPFPALDIPYIAEVFDGNSTCTGLATRRYLLPTGLDEDNVPYTVNSVNIPLDEFIFTVDVAALESFTLPLPPGFNYNLNIDWGDSNTSTATEYDSTGATNTYVVGGEYVVRVSGLAEALNCQPSPSCANITHVLNFGDLGYIDLSNSFTSSSSLKSFSGGKTSAVTNIKEFLYGATALTSVDLTSFDTSNVTDMSGMFNGASLLTKLDLSSFNTSSVTNMTTMFANTSSLVSLDLSGFDTSSITNMGSMFQDASSLISLDISGFNTSNVTNMSLMFNGASALTNLDLSNFNTSNVTTMYGMFKYASSLTSLDLSGFNTSSVTNMSYMFQDATLLASLDLSGFDTSNVIDMGSMFDATSSLTNLDLSGFDTSSVTNMSFMFQDATSLASLDLSGFDTSSTANFRAMFKNTPALSSLNISNFDTSLATNMSYMFEGASLLSTLDVSSFNTSAVTTMVYMFKGMSSLTSLDLTNFDTASVVDMLSMFENTTSLSSLDVTGFDITSSSGSTDVFLGTNGGLSVYCNNQDTVNDGTGVDATGTFFGQTCL